MLYLCDLPPDDLDVVGILLGRTGEDQDHVGVLYRRDEDIGLCHLKWHYRLSFEPPPGPDSRFLWLKVLAPDMETLRAVAAVIGAIEIGQPKIPYGLSWEGDAFNPDGTLMAPMNGQGLTCSTFVLKVFLRAGINLINTEGWLPRDGDDLFREKILGWLRQTDGVPEDYVKAVENEPFNARVKPGDVAAAAILLDRPCEPILLQPLGDEITQELHNRKAWD